MPIQLLITNIGFTFSFITCLTLGIFVFVRRPKNNKKSSVNIIFLLFSISVCVWIVSYALGINLHDPNYSRIAFLFNIATLYIAILSAHLILVLTGRLEGRKKLLKLFYFIATALVIFFALFPETLLLQSQGRLYLPNFLVLGPLYFLQDFFFFGLTLYLLFQLMIGYRNADYVNKNRLKYFIVGFVYGYILALIPEFLLYDIPVDPMPAAFFGLYTIPMAYAILKYDAIDINIVARKALGYALGIAGVTLLILLTGYANNYVHYFFEDLPQWVLPLISAIITVIVGFFVWNKVREVNTLKYQFVDVVTHKFRTPLTYIKWSIDTLKNPDNSKEEKDKAISAIADAQIRLIELTDSLIGLSSADDSQFLYSYKSENVRELISEAINSADTRIKEKGIVIENNIPESMPDIYVDKKKIMFALQMVIDNAVIYSFNKGVIEISAEVKNDFVFISIRDHGIGIKPQDLNRLFSKFFRSTDAMHAHTEGLGIGLYISRDILSRQGGDLTVESEGQNKGSTFVFKIPLAR